MARTTLLSPARYLRMGYGLALPSNYTLSQLRSALVRAQEKVNRFCNVPREPALFDWRGGTMVNETHQWRMTNPLAYGPGARRLYTNVGPIKSVSAFSLDLGKTYLVTIDPTRDIYINSMEQYVEIVAISPTIVGNYPLNINLGLYNPVARISYSYGWSFDVTGDILEAESPKVFSGSYGNWDPTVPPVVLIGDDEIDPGDYAVDYDDGTITFATAPDPRTLVYAEYTYLAPSAVVDAVGITATAELASARMSARGMAGLQSLRVAEVSLTRMAPTATRNGTLIPAEAAELLGAFIQNGVGGS